MLVPLEGDPRERLELRFDEPRGRVTPRVQLDLRIVELLERGGALPLQLRFTRRLDPLAQRLDRGAVGFRRALDLRDALTHQALQRVTLLRQLGALLRDDALHLRPLGGDQPLRGSELTLERLLL